MSERKPPNSNNLICTIFAICFIFVVVGAGYVYFTRDAGEPAEKDIPPGQVVDDSNKAGTEHKVMKPVIPDEGTKPGDKTATEEKKADDVEQDKASDQSAADKNENEKKNDDKSKDNGSD